MARFLYIMEGEIEDKFILFLQQKKILKPGKRQVFNFDAEQIETI